MQNNNIENSIRMENETWNNNASKTQAEYFAASDLPEMETQYKSLLFDDNSIRKRFIRKVYLILVAQLMMTLAILAIFVYSTTLSEFVVLHPAIFWPALLILLVTMLIMMCCEEARRQTPMNYIFLAIFTVAQSVLLAIIACQFDPVEILLAVGTTAAICFSLSLYALQTKYDFTMMGSILLMSLVVLFIFGIFTIFFPVRAMVLVNSSLGAVLFSIYMVYDTQLMMGGQHKYALNPEEYVFAALNLYLDTVNMFLYILSLISGGRT